MPGTSHDDERRAETEHANMDHKQLLIGAGANSRGGLQWRYRIESRTGRADWPARVTIGFVL